MFARQVDDPADLIAVVVVTRTSIDLDLSQREVGIGDRLNCEPYRLVAVLAAIGTEQFSPAARLVQLQRPEIPFISDPKLPVGPVMA